MASPSSSPSPYPTEDIDHGALAALGHAFGQEHERIYGRRAGAEEPVELVSLAVNCRARATDRPLLDATPATAPAGPNRSRTAYFGPGTGWQEATLLQRADLVTPRMGPLIIEEYDATLVIPPGCRASLGEGGSVLVEVTPGG